MATAIFHTLKQNQNVFSGGLEKMQVTNKSKKE